jgi:hypothetical protein
MAKKSHSNEFTKVSFVPKIMFRMLWLVGTNQPSSYQGAASSNCHHYKSYKNVMHSVEAQAGSVPLLIHTPHISENLRIVCHDSFHAAWFLCTGIKNIIIFGAQ